MLKIQTLADLKRIPVGTRLRLTYCITGPVAPEKQLRTVREVRSKDLIVEPDHNPGAKSYLNFPKAADFRPTEKGFEVWERHLTGDPSGPLRSRRGCLLSRSQKAIPVIHTFAQARDVWIAGKRKLDHNTYLVEVAGGFAIKLHDTCIVSYLENGDVLLNTGGWRTATTRNRMRDYFPCGDWKPGRKPHTKRPWIRWSLGVKRGQWTVDCERMQPRTMVSAQGYRTTIHDPKLIKSYPYSSDLLFLKKSRTYGGFRKGP